LNEHIAVRAELSAAVQFTVVAPSGRFDPDAGVHVVCTGGAPPVTTGASKVTA
jgi:hypothetical protein